MYGNRFNFCRGRSFFLSSACDMLITSFLISSPGLNGVYHLSLFIRKHLYKLKGGNIFPLGVK